MCSAVDTEEENRSTVGLFQMKRSNTSCTLEKIDRRGFFPMCLLQEETVEWIFSSVWQGETLWGKAQRREEHLCHCWPLHLAGKCRKQRRAGFSAALHCIAFHCVALRCSCWRGWHSWVLTPPLYSAQCSLQCDCWPAVAACWLRSGTALYILQAFAWCCLGFHTVLPSVALYCRQYWDSIDTLMMPFTGRFTLEEKCSPQVWVDCSQVPQPTFKSVGEPDSRGGLAISSMNWDHKWGGINCNLSFLNHSPVNCYRECQYCHFVRCIVIVSVAFPQLWLYYCWTLITCHTLTMWSQVLQLGSVITGFSELLLVF